MTHNSLPHQENRNSTFSVPKTWLPLPPSILSSSSGNANGSVFQIQSKIWPLLTTCLPQSPRPPLLLTCHHSSLLLASTHDTSILIKWETHDQKARACCSPVQCLPALLRANAKVFVMIYNILSVLTPITSDLVPSFHSFIHSGFPATPLASQDIFIS